MMDEVAANIFKVFEALKPTGTFLSTPIKVPAHLEAQFDAMSVRIDQRQFASAAAAALTTRLSTYFRKLAAILSAMNGEHEISLGALEAAAAWVDYCAATVEVFATTAAERQKRKQVAEDGEAILVALRTLGGDKGPLPHRVVHRATLLDLQRFQDALAKLMRMGPSPVVVTEDKRVVGMGLSARGP